MTEAETPLARIIKAEIGKSGPMPVSAFMARALTDPDHGYYTTATPFGVDGDFITAPEMSQLFGEIVGAWAVHVAEVIATAIPDGPIHLIEPGPGRGTLMADILRVASLRPELDARVEVHLVEASPKLRETQRATIGKARPDRTEPNWHAEIGTIPEGPFVLVANEFFDALPVEQAVKTNGGWRRRVVSLEDGNLAFAAGEAAQVPEQFNDAQQGAILETCPPAAGIAKNLTQRMTRQPGVVLVIDYGYDMPATGDTLQAVRRHKSCDPLEHIGQADLTAHVCFGALAHAAITAGAQAFGPMPQAQFLSELGMAERAEKLMAARPDRRGDIETAFTRLVSPDAMGSLFKVMALTSPGMGAPPPFANA
ncbi:MAG: SAM-dependent methyltransferase [Tepidamorphaceae bacterium]|nr:SAM-dependent methyltransferase [Rhodobiaceae bacterium]MCC0049629.1 SAM-dependent methyltransferase [Rhodobiaceae bacterium]